MWLALENRETDSVAVRSAAAYKEAAALAGC
jgi:hypothetical protein